MDFLCIELRTNSWDPKGFQCIVLGWGAVGPGLKAI